jgi:thiol-disulfide isomerase/thioredoxin
MNAFTVTLLLSSVVLPAEAQVQVVKFPDLERLIGSGSDTVLVVNFWATWCSPCVEELPHFEQAQAKYAAANVRVVLVSLDFKSQLDSKVLPFIKKHNIRSRVVLLDEPDGNSYIDRVDPSWSGAIPATLVIHGSRRIRRFYEKTFTFGELDSLIQSLIERN